MEQPRLISPRKINSSLSAVDNCSMIIRETLSEVKNYGATAHADFVSLVFVSSLLFVLQTLTGGLIAHYRAEPEGFFGIDFSAILPFNIMRTWHVQLAIFWVSASYLATACVT
jgi:nitric oxide reductase large subunit